MGGNVLGKALKNKDLKNTKLATNYGGWMYCTGCNQNIGYLCYVTYDCLKLDYVCNCGSTGHAFLDFQDSVIGNPSSEDMVMIKNRLCCHDDQSPLITILSDKLTSYDLSITCKSCGKIYKEKK